MFGGGYKIITLVGTGTESWEKAAKTLQDSGIARVQELDMHIGDGKIIAYRAKVRVPSKYHGEEEALQTLEGLPKVEYLLEGALEF
jgi:flavin-binding protein dodecin